MSTDEDETERIDYAARKRAFERTRAASNALDAAARALGYDDVHELGTAAYDGKIPAKRTDAVRAITNAHSYLNNGSLNALFDEDELTRDDGGDS